MQPPAKKVKTEEDADASTAQLTLTAPPGYWIEKQYKTRSSYQNYHLPPHCQDQWWPKQFLPTLYLWAGSQNDLWKFLDAPLVKALQSIYDVVYSEESDLDYKVTAQGSVFGIVSRIFFLSLLLMVTISIRPPNVLQSGAAILDQWDWLL